MPTFGDEGGLRNHRTEFVRENVDDNGDPVTPDNPKFELYSDRVRNVEWAPTPGAEAERGLGDADPDDHEKAPEEHELTVVYDFQKWFVDGSGNPQDASADGILRTSDNRLPNTHTFVDREQKSTISPAAQWSDDGTHRESRTYTVGRGGGIDEVAITGDPGEQQPVTIELTYTFEKIRTYHIDQPASGVTLIVKSTNADDTMGVTIESEGGASTETLTLNGTSMVAGSTSFSDIDAVSLDSKPQGTIEVFVNDGTTSTPTQGIKLTEVKGATDYSDDGTVGGDLGVPALGTGSHAPEIGTPFETVLGDKIAWGSDPLAMDVNSRTITVSNNTEVTPREDSVAQRLHVGNRNTEVEATTIGEQDSHGKISKSLAVHGADITWTFAGGTLTVTNARLTEPGERANEVGQTSMQLENTFSGEGVSIA